ncbi:MAG: M48 family metallopeptidase, partial [Betaproteobacteria bacterium]|nr:M48 family metallopeptidase [Betaproteobacteria bacterium]
MLIPALFMSLSPALAQNLPELGDASAAALSPQVERRIGEEAMRDIRLRDPNFLDDPEVTTYINTLGARLVAAVPEARQDFEFFLVRDTSVNAFAMPGGFVGVHTGLVIAAQTESELASVLAHEVAHISQRHMARMLGKQDQLSIPTVAAVIVAVLAARSKSDVSSAAMAAATAGSLQAQLNYTREFEREADRIGFQILQRSGWDVQGMPSFFERLQKFGRLYDNNAPAYLRTHPLTSERIADMQNRAQSAAYRQLADSVEFRLVRAKLRAEQGTPGEALALFEEQVRSRRYSDEAAARYGLATALERAKAFARAQAELPALRALTGSHPMVELLAARIKAGSGDVKGARELVGAASLRHAGYRPLRYAELQYLQALGQHREAIAALADLGKLYPRDPRLWNLRAKSYAAMGKRLLQHQALAEVYYLQGTLPAAVEQLQLAQRSGDGDFY